VVAVLLRQHLVREETSARSMNHRKSAIAATHQIKSD
jgi:hypothetical protein